MEGVLNDGFLLIIIKPGGKQISGMVIDGRGQIGLYLCTVFPDGQFGTIYLEASDPEKDIQLYINSPGGSVTAGFAIYDTMQYVKCDVSTIFVFSNHNC